MDIFQALKEDHDNVKHLFKDLQSQITPSSTGEKTFMDIRRELAMHMEGEETVVYPVFERIEEAREKTLEGYEEHNVVKNLLKDMSSFPKDNERWLPKVNVLKEIVERHMEAEESKLFRQVRRGLGKDRAEELAMRFEERKMRRKAA